MTVNRKMLLHVRLLSAGAGVWMSAVGVTPPFSEGLFHANIRPIVNAHPSAITTPVFVVDLHPIYFFCYACVTLDCEGLHSLPSEPRFWLLRYEPKV
jgi:hypothetical protein